jgi:hypothetical protein
MIARHIAALKEMKGKSVEAGWFESAQYPSVDGQQGRSVAANARFLEFGGTIDHPGGTKYITDAATSTRMLGTRFVKNSFQGEHKVTQAHQIVIPARPFMRLAWSTFNADRSSIQKRIAQDLISGKITIDQALGQIGLELEKHIVKSIRNGNWAPNARSTVSAKGFDKPLIETSFMWQSVTSKVS